MCLKMITRDMHTKRRGNYLDNVVMWFIDNQKALNRDTMWNEKSVFVRMSMNVTAKFFNELTTKELYEILKARAEIFVVEQNCVYQDLDGKDYESLHVFYEENGKVAAYLRAFYRDNNVVQIGRVLTLQHGTGLGGKLLKEGIAHIKEKMNPGQLYIEAQCYATGYYEREGFEVCSDEFLEDGIPHVQMILDL